MNDWAVKNKILCLKNRRKILGSSQYRKCKENLSPLYPQLFKHKTHFSRWAFHSKKFRVKYDQYLAEPHPQADIHIGLPRQIKHYAE